MTITPFVRAQLSWAVFLLALFGMLELADEQNLALFYSFAILGYFHSRTLGQLSHPYWVVDVILGVGLIYILGRFIAGT